MQFVKIQDKDTLKIIQWRVDGRRVKKHDYDHYLSCMGYNGYCNSSTTRTKSGNFRHSFYTGEL